MIFQTKIGVFIQLVSSISVSALSLCPSPPSLQAEHLLGKDVPATVNVAHIQASYHSLLHFLSSLDKLFQEHVSDVPVTTHPVFILVSFLSIFFLFAVGSSHKL